MLKLKLTGLIIFTCILHSFSQTNIWYFGTNAGLKFNSNGTTSPEGGSLMSTNEGCTAATDNSGNLLFYGDGENLWHGDNKTAIASKKLKNQMLGSPSSTQAAIIVPLPGNACTKFLVFTTEGVENTFTYGVGVALVTVSGSAPNHTIIYSQAVSLNGVRYSEKLAVTSDGTGGWWLVAHDYSTSNGGTTFYKYHINSDFANANSSEEVKSLLNKNVYTQSIGTAHNGSVYNAQGQMKFTKDGKKLGLVVSGTKVAQTYLFDKTSIEGKLTVDKTIPVGDPNTNNTYGFEFSPDGTKIYVGEGYGNNSTSNLYQYDITTQIPGRTTLASIPSSESQTLPTGSYTSRYAFNGMQLGPDNRIYICGPYENKSTLSVINAPNISGSSCNYDDISVSISGTSKLNLPTVIAAQVSCEPIITSQGCNCTGVTASLSSLSLTSAAGNATASFKLSSGSNKIKKIRITLLNYIVTPNNVSCKNYSTMTNDDFGKFVMPSGILKDYAAMFSPYKQMTSAQSSSDVELTTSAPRAINNESITFNLKFPPILALSCCTQTVSACFRVEFIDADCKICDVVICNSNAEIPSGGPITPPTSTPPINMKAQEGNTISQDFQRNNDPHMKVYPNPNNGNFTINTSEIGSNCKFQVMSLEGREIQSGEIKGESQELNSNLLPGMYSVFVFKENQVFTEKIVVSRD